MHAKPQFLRRSSRLRRPSRPFSFPPPHSPSSSTPSAPYPSPRARLRQLRSARGSSSVPRSPLPKQPPPVPTARASRALKRRRLSEESQDLHIESDEPRSIKRRKTLGDPRSSKSQRRSKPNPPPAPVNPLTLAPSDDPLTSQFQPSSEPTPPPAPINSLTLAPSDNPLTSKFQPRSELTLPPAPANSLTLASSDDPLTSKSQSEPTPPPAPVNSLTLASSDDLLTSKSQPRSEPNPPPAPVNSLTLASSDDPLTSKSQSRSEPTPPPAPVNSLTLASSDDIDVQSTFGSAQSAPGILDFSINQSPEPNTPTLDASPLSVFVQGPSISDDDIMDVDEPFPSAAQGPEVPASASCQQVAPPAVQPLSYSRFPRRGRSPLSLSMAVPESPINPLCSFPPLPLSHPACLSSPRPRKRRSLYLENQGRIGDVWKYVCIERVETQFAKYGYSNVLAAERQVTGACASLDRSQFRISTPSNYDDIDMGYDDDDDDEDDCDFDDIDQEILKTIEEELREEDGMLDIDAEGELDPDHLSGVEEPMDTSDSLSIDCDHFPAFLPQPSDSPPRCPSIPVPFPLLGSVRVPGVGNAISDDVKIGPVEMKLSKGLRSRRVINVKGRDIEEWKAEESGEPMGRGTPVDARKRNDWLFGSPLTWDPTPPSAKPSSALDHSVGIGSTSDPAQAITPAGNGVCQDWRAFLDNLARILNSRANSSDGVSSFSPTVAEPNLSDFTLDISPTALPPSLSSLLDQPDQLYGRHLTLALPGPEGFSTSLAGMTNAVVTSGVPTPSYTSSSSTLSRALG